VTSCTTHTAATCTDNTVDAIIYSSLHKVSPNSNISFVGIAIVGSIKNKWHDRLPVCIDYVTTQLTAKIALNCVKK
jgi:hypothetical protein